MNLQVSKLSDKEFRNTTSLRQENEHVTSMDNLEAKREKKEPSQSTISANGNAVGHANGKHRPDGAKSVSQIIVKTIREEGWRGFYRGLSSALLSASLKEAFIFASKERFMKLAFIFVLYFGYLVEFRKNVRSLLLGN